MATDAEIEQKANELRIRYNPSDISPFPFEKILADKTDLRIYITELQDNNISGAILYDPKEKKFEIVINKNKPDVRRYFTTAHELGHYFLHSDYIITSKGLVDGENTLEGNTALFRDDNTTSTTFEIEANRFAAALLMPGDLVAKAWSELKSVEACARAFNVSISAMSIRLERLGLVN
jgi:Zn-dependent peptidase ImmA (M78 family)